MVHADGSLASGPIALSEVQAYTHAALLALAELEQRIGDGRRVDRLSALADDLRARFETTFWLPEDGIVAMALDGQKRPLRVPSSNMGHCLWAGVLRPDVAHAVAERLSRPDLLTRWGLRTLSSEAVAYNPLGYHLGSIWPHDTALAAAGAMRHGHTDLAIRLVEALLRVAERSGWRLPELYGGLDDAAIDDVVPYPVASSPQAWSAAVPLLLLRVMLGVHPDVPAGRVALTPAFTASAGLTVRGIPLGAGHLDVAVEGARVDVLQAPAGLSIVVPGQSPARVR